MKTIKLSMLVGVLLASFGATSTLALAGQGQTSARAPYTEGLLVVGSQGAFTKGTRWDASQAGNRFLAAGTRRPDPFLDGSRSITDPRDPFTDGARSGTGSIEAHLLAVGKRQPDPFTDGGNAATGPRDPFTDGNRARENVGARAA